MPAHAAQLQLIALPKGLTGGTRLRVTLCLRPSRGCGINLPAYVRAIEHFELEVASATHAVMGKVRVRIDATQRALPDPELWDRLMKGATPCGDIASNPPTMLAVQTASIAKMLDLMRTEMREDPSMPVASQQNSGGLFQAAATRSDLQEESRLTSLRPGWRRKGTGARSQDGRSVSSAAIAGVAEMSARSQVNALDDAEAGLHVLYNVADGALKSPAAALQNVDASQAQEELLLAQFNDTRCLPLLQAYAPGGNAGETLRRLGMRGNEATAAALAGRWRAMTSGKPPAADAPLSFRDLWIDCLLSTAPFRPSLVAASNSRMLAGTSPLQAEDSYENRLAAVIQELPLHPVFGLAVDLGFELPPDLLRAISKGDVWIRVRPIESTALLEEHWTAVNRDGWPRPKATGVPGVPSAMHDPDTFTADGWMTLPSERAHLSNLPVLESIQKVAHAVLQRMTARATGTAQDASPPPNFRSGPVVLHLSGDGHSKRDQAMAQAGEDPFPELLHLEDLVQGVRPVIRFRDASGRLTTSALLRRSVSYQDVGDATLALARALEGGGATREEGQISRLRAAAAAGDGSEPYNEQVFEWGDWNPAVPFPGTAINNNPKDLLPKTLRALPDANPPYRFGLDVNVACRWVLLDGSSRIPADQIEHANAPWFPGGNGFRIRRHEPLLKPLVLMRDDPPNTPLLEDETTTEVVLASRLTGHPLREASVRYLLAGPTKDLIDVVRHGTFDDGTSPKSSAYRDIERSTKVESLFPTVQRGKAEVPVFRRHSRPVAIAPTQLLRPDPLASGLRFILARRDPLGNWLPLMDRNKSPARALQIDVPLYPRRQWPDAVVVRMLVEAIERERNANPLEVEHDDREMRVRVRVPAGEQFSVLIVPFAHPDAKSYLHAMHDLPDIDPAMSDKQVIGVNHFVDRPLAPDITKFTQRNRESQERSAALSLKAKIDPGSTATLDLYADWREPLDDPAMPRPIDVSDQAAPARSYLVGQLTRYIQPAIDRLADDPAFCVIERPPIVLSNASDDSEIPLVHDLPDTKYRLVSYRLQSLARSSNGLANILGEQARRSTDSMPVQVKVLASAPPLAPQVRELQLAFRFERRMQQLTSTSDRHCALSVVMERGWWSSGPGELLGVVVGPIAVPGRRLDATSLWAEDPMRPSIAAYPTSLSRQDFLSTQQSREQALGPEDLVLYEPQFDPSCDAWRVDIALRLTDVHLQPFVQLVLVRWQENAIEGATTSPPVVVDFYQLPSRRSATVSYLPETGELNIVVCGAVDPESYLDSHAPGETLKPGYAVLEAMVQYTEGAGFGADVWMDFGEAELLEADPKATGGRWHKKFPVPPKVRRQKLRVALFERMCFGDTFGPPSYIDAVPLHLMQDVSRGD